MKLLFDQNLSFKLCEFLQAAFPGSRHVKDIGLTEALDEEIWDVAAQEKFVVVSKDADFLHKSLLFGHPPKVIQLQVGNCPTRRIRDLFMLEEKIIKEFLLDPDEALLIIEEEG